jgi:chromosome segregation ATPase
MSEEQPTDALSRIETLCERIADRQLDHDARLSSIDARLINFEDDLGTLTTRVSQQEQRLRRLHSEAPRAMRAVSESKHEFDTTTLAIAEHQADVVKALNELTEANDRNTQRLADLSRKETRKLGAIALFIAPIVPKIFDLFTAWLAYRGH